MQVLPSAFNSLSAWNQFVCWKPVPSKTRPGKVDKFPCTADGRIIDAHDSKHWMTAVEACNSGLDVGFVFTSNDPFFFIDIDGAYDGKAWSTVATQLCAEFAGASVEVSSSGTGLHIIGQYAGDEPDHACKNIPLHLELYTSGRFVALTGTGVTGDAGKVCNDALGRTIDGYFSPSSDTERPAAEWTTAPVEGAYPIEDDNKLITKACESTSMFGQNAPFKALWHADAEVLCQYYPDEGGQARSFDASSADAALAQHLSWWTGGDCGRIERLMRVSGLVRPKWDNHKTYMQRTILSATARTTSYYDKGKPVTIVEPNLKDYTPQVKDANQYIPIDQQTTMFAGCVYICDIHRVFTPRGALLKKEQFNSMYGGYRFCIDHDNEKTTTSAWDAFVESQTLQWRKADSSCFRPDLEPGEIIEKEGVRCVNVYMPLDIQYTDGDVTPFMTHLKKLLPDERDQTILLSYMAACVQHKGYKIQWAPLIQGVEGNGKTLFTRCLKYAIGDKYSHMPNASKIDSEFNGWLLNKLFIGVEDIYVPEHRREILERLKPMITGGDGLEIQLKGVDQVTRDICANFMLNSNHKDAIKKTLNDRRYCVFYTAQQEAAHIVRDGLTGEYFQKLYQWLRDGGYAAVAGMLNRYEIPAQFNPTGLCQRAPETSSTHEAVEQGLGGVEQEILEAISEDRTGFANGWVSSLALDTLIRDLRKDNMIPRNKRRELMKSLGYDYHPSLKDGRVNNGLPIDGMKKPRLYIRTGHLALNLTRPVEIAQQYSHDQGDHLAGNLIDKAVKHG